MTETGRWQIYGVVFSTDGTTLTSIQQGGVIRVWDIASGKQIGPSQKHPGKAYERYGLARSPDGKIIATVGTEDVRTWDAASLMPLDTFPTGGPMGHDTPGIAFSPDGNLLAASSKLDLQVWDLKTGQDHLTIPSAHAEGAATGTMRGRLSGHAGDICLITFSADGKTLFLVGSDKQLRIWDISAAKVTRTIEITGHEGSHVNRAAISRDKRHLATCEMFGKIVVITDIATGTRIREISLPDALGNLLAISHDGQLLASACQPISNTDRRFDEQIHLWDIATGQKLCSFDASTDGTVAMLRFLSDGKMLASGMDRGTSLIWDTSTIQGR